jgi:hypothetical protein
MNYISNALFVPPSYDIKDEQWMIDNGWIESN